MSLGGASMPIGSPEDGPRVQREPGASMPIVSLEDAPPKRRPEDGSRVQREPGASMPIGVFDSGLGGLTVLSEIHRVLPHENLVYFGDTARVPYGNKSSTTIIRYAREITKFLLKQNVKAIVVACNTASSYALEAIREMTEIKVLGVIDPAVRSLSALAPAAAVAGLIATKGTIASRAYEASLERHKGAQKLVTQPCPLLVPLIEEGYASSKAADLILQDYLEPLAKSGVEYLLLGCTHYPLIASSIKRLYPQFILIDSAAETAITLQSLLSEAKLLGHAERPVVDLFVSDMTESMKNLKDLFFAGKVDRFEVAQINEEM